MDPRALIDLDRYPIDREGPPRDDLVARVQAALARDGCAVVERFATAAGVAALAEEADGVAGNGHRSFSRTNAYFTADDPSLPPDDPRRRFFDRSNTFIPADNFRPHGPLRTIHDFPAFDPFIRDCVAQPRFYRYVDPLADVIVNMAEAGEGFPWHFDTNAFTVTLAIQNADAGGAFKYAADIRDDGQENFAEVANVLDGVSDRVTTLELGPGDLQIFMGRHSLHRVAPLKGGRRRYVAIFSYVEEPDMVGSPERYGRVLPIHLERAGRRADSLID